MTDPIADMLTQIRNAISSGKAEVVFSHSKFKQQLAEIMAKEGLIEKYSAALDGRQKTLELKFKYVGGKPVISGITRISSPGQRIYSKAADIPRVQGGYGVTIVSTSKGLLTDYQARKEHLGGEVICQVW